MQGNYNMKKILFVSLSVLTLSVPVLAQDLQVFENQATSSMQHSTQNDSMMEKITYLQNEWARIKYQIPDKEKQLSTIHKLEEQAEQLTNQYPNFAEPKIWQGIILSTDAGIVKGLSALSKVKKAKQLFEASLKQNPRALDGSAYASLGSLYYQVPGWPVAFGNDEKAKENLNTALEINPQGIDPNYFYGDFLLQNNQPQEAKKFFKRALLAPDRSGRALADAGRRQEIKAKLASIDQS